MKLLNMPTTSGNPEIAINKLLPNLPVVETAVNLEVTVNVPCIVIWDSGDSHGWYVCISIANNSNGTFVIDQMKRCDGVRDDNLGGMKKFFFQIKKKQVC